MQTVKRRKNVFCRLGEAFRRGSIGTKLSFLVMGAGQVFHRQYLKGSLYFLLQLAFVLFLTLFGGQYILALFSGNLGTKVSGTIWNEQLQIYEKVRGDNSFLILLYGVVTLSVCLLFVIVWSINVFGSYETDELKKAGKRPTTFREDFKILFGEKFYIPLLLLPFAGLLIFTVLPLIFMVLIAFTNYDYAHMPPGRLFDWVGFANFKTLFSLSGGSSGFAMVFFAGPRLDVRLGVFCDV